MKDILRMEHINSLAQPFMATFYGGDEWPVYDIEVRTGLVRIDVVGKLQICDISDINFFTDEEGNKHDSDTFYHD